LAHRKGTTAQFFDGAAVNNGPRQPAQTAGALIGRDRRAWVLQA
jgi:hypothetical protein